MDNKNKYDYQGYHATADIILNDYPENIIDLFRDSIKHSKLNIVDEKIHDFGGASTGVFILSESHATIHEYPEHNYVTIDIYTCGKEGDPLAAIKYFESILNVYKSVTHFINRGQFDM